MYAYIAAWPQSGDRQACLSSVWYDYVPRIKLKSPATFQFPWTKVSHSSRDCYKVYSPSLSGRDSIPLFANPIDRWTKASSSRQPRYHKMKTGFHWTQSRPNVQANFISPLTTVLPGYNQWIYGSSFTRDSPITIFCCNAKKKESIKGTLLTRKNDKNDLRRRIFIELAKNNLPYHGACSPANSGIRNPFHGFA